MSALTAKRPRWIAVSRSSAACNVRLIAGSSTMPAEPLSVWKARKMRSIRSTGDALALDCDQVVGRLMDQLARFGDELLLQGVHAGAPVSTATWRIRSASETGLTR